MGVLLPNIKQQYFDANGDPLSGGKIYTYEAGSTTPLASYSDQGLTVPNSNPVVLDANGEPSGAIYIPSGVPLKVVVKDSSDVTLKTIDNYTDPAASDTSGTGDVVGPAASINNEIALFSSTTGKLIKRASGTGFVKSTAGVASFSSTVNLATEVTGTLPIIDGGTAGTTATEALTNLLPDQSGNSGKVLTSDGSAASWQSPTGALRSGSASISNAAQTVTVSFSSSTSDTTYKISLSLVNTTDSDPIFLIAVVTAKTTSGFTVKFNTATDSANYSLEYTINAPI